MGKPKRTNKAVFSITLSVGKDIVTSSAITAFDALKALPKPTKIVGKGVVTISHNGKTFSRLFMPNELKRLFWPMAQAVQAKQLEIAVK